MTALIGKSLGRYHILEPLGEGGMAFVYKAYDTRLETDVAVKVIRTENILPSVLERSLKRFEREAKSLARLTHPNIVKVTDYGEFEGKPYLVMPYLPGGTLKDRIKQGQIPWQEAVRLILPIAQALEYAHEHNIIHRDVKPSNILLTEKGQPMLTDFGVAKLFDMDATADLTGTGMGVGTPEYMAPEQWQGQVSVQTDVYALGVVLYEMVTGKRPYTADTPAALLIKQTNDPLPRPKSFVPELPDEVENILFKALAKKIEDRYQTMTAYFNAMEGAVHRTSISRTQSVQSIEGMTLTVPERGELPTRGKEDSTVHKQPKRNGLIWVIGSGLFLLGCIGAFFLLRELFSTLLPIVTPSPSSLVSTNLPLITPTSSLSILSGTNSPLQLTGISIENASQVVQLARLGKGSVNQVEWSPDGNLVAVASSLGVYLYDPQTIQVVRMLETDTIAWSVSFSLDSETLAVGLHTGEIQLWRISDGTLLHTLEGHTREVISIAFSPNGEYLASGSYDQTVRVWRVSDGSSQRVLDGHTDDVTSVAFSPDGKTLASGSDDSTVRLWTLDGNLIRTFNGSKYMVRSIAFSPDGKLFASGGGVDENVYLWKVSDGSLLQTFNIDAKDNSIGIKKIAFSPNGEILALGLYSTIQLWRISDGTRLRTLDQKGGADSVSFSPDGNTLASGPGDSMVYFWQVSDGSLLRTIEGHTDYVSSVTFLLDGHTLASNSPFDKLRIWNIAESSLLRSLQEKDFGVVAFSSDGETMASGSWYTKVNLWRVSDQSLIRTMEGHTEAIVSLAFSPSGDFLASGARDNTIRIWRKSDGFLLQTLIGHTDSVNSLSFSSDGQVLASGSSDGTIKLWRVSDGSLIRTLNGHTDEVASVVFSPDGNSLASGSKDKTVRIWNASTGSLLYKLEGNSWYVTSVAFSPDGMIIAASSWDTIQLWKVSDGSHLCTLTGHIYTVTSVTFSPDGKFIASGGEDGTVRIWGLIP